MSQEIIDFDPRNPPDDVLSYHEAGHAMMLIVLDVPFEYVTIIPDEECKAHLHPTCEWNELRYKLEHQKLSDDEKETFLKYIRMQYAGPLAEGKYISIPQWWEHKSSGNDFSAAFGELEFLTNRDFSLIETKKEELLNDVKSILSKEENWQLVERLAANLLEKRCLSYKECKSL